MTLAGIGAAALLACSSDEELEPVPFDNPIVLPPRVDAGPPDGTGAPLGAPGTPGSPSGAGGAGGAGGATGAAPTLRADVSKTAWTWTVAGAGPSGEVRSRDLTAGTTRAPEWAPLGTLGFAYDPVTGSHRLTRSFNAYPANERGHTIELTARSPGGPAAALTAMLPPIPAVRATYTPGARVTIQVTGAESKLDVKKAGPNKPFDWSRYAPTEWTYDAATDVYTHDQPKSGYCAGYSSPYGWIMAYEFSFRNGAYVGSAPVHTITVQVTCP